jgi:NADH-quinone oxidoreductase subunit M
MVIAMSLETLGLLAILVVPLIVASVLALFPRRLRHSAGWLAGAAAGVSLAASFALIPALRHGAEPAIRLIWVPAAAIEMRLHLDWLTLPFLITEAGVTLLAIVYTWGYYAAETIDPSATSKTTKTRPKTRRPYPSYFYALLLLFAVGMSGTTLADNMILFYTFWELMLMASAVLILVWGEAVKGGTQKQTVTLKYFIFTHMGSLLILIALLILYDAVGSDSFSALRQGVTLAPALATTVTTLFLIGFCVKMAIFPLHLWLPDAHTVAPMPVTIMLAAAMLSMGTYGILRFPMSLFSRAHMQAFATPMMIAGILSEVYGALMALAERDIKRIVAYSSVSQMGYILFGLGTLTADGVAGATLHVIYHAIVKALLFMVLGLVIHATHKRHIDDLGGLGRAMPITAACAMIGALAMAGMPPLCIFDSEWMIFAGGFHTAHIGLSAASLFASLLTVAYALWLVVRIFLGTSVGDLAQQNVIGDRPLAMLVPTVILAALTIIEGVFPAPLFDWVMHELPLLLGGQW